MAAFKTELSGINRFLSSLHGRFLRMILAAVISASIILTLVNLSISYAVLKIQFDRSNILILKKLEKIISVPYIKQDYVMIVDIIDAEFNSSSFKYIWITDENDIVAACSDENQVSRPIEAKYTSNKNFRFMKSDAGFGIGIIPDFKVIEMIGTGILAGNIIAVIVLTFIIVILTDRFSRKFSEPISLSVQASAEIASGNFDIFLGRNKIPEIDVLFLSMTDTARKLKSLTEDLERDKKKIKESEERYRRLIENFPDTYFFFSHTVNGEITYLSPSVENILGRSLINNIDSLFGDLKDNARNRAAKEFMKLSMSGVKQKPFEIETCHADGSSKVLEIFEVPVFLSDWSVAYVEGIAHDITAQRIAEAQLIQAQKMEIIGTLAGGIAHDFNNILSGIIGSISIMKARREMGTVSEKGLDDFIEIMEHSGNRASELVNQILSLSRKYESNFVHVDLNDVIQQTAKICRNSFDKRINISTEPYNGKAIVLADSVQVEQVLVNLCINAYHAMTIMRENESEWGGALSVSLKKIPLSKNFSFFHPDAEDVDYWIIEITDTGIGIDPKIQSKIFDPFFTTKEKGKGTGLGLAMVYNIVKQHGGFIDVYSEPGTGTTFNVFFPATSFIEKEEKNEEERVFRGSGLVLVIDDEEIMRSIAKTILEDCGYEVITAVDGQDGIEKFMENRENIKAILLDMVMPRKSGKDCFIELKKIDNKIKVLVASGFRKDERVEDILALGASDFIQKPYTLHELSKRMKSLINRS